MHQNRCFKCGRNVYTEEREKLVACPQCDKLLTQFWEECKRTRHIRLPSPSAGSVMPKG